MATSDNTPSGSRARTSNPSSATSAWTTSRSLKGLDLRAGDLWYRIETKRGGPLLITASAKDERSDLAIKLYDGNLRELAVSDELAVSLRHRVAKGAAYHLQVSGRSDSLGLRLQIGGTPFAHPLSEEAANHKR
jgi:hypothetical protein